jgi:D-alanyl-D-alanine carboxypeptidase/D-alanyl-D-alanine-endopeptidase (penicillin-binding protein 4)
MAESPTRAVRFVAGALVFALFTGTLQAQSPAATTGPLAARIDSILASAPYSRAHWGIAVADARTADVVYERAADKLFIPASNLKLVVATTAAKLLGADFAYRTRLLAGGPIPDGILGGDLIVSGSGDPTISGRYADGNRTAVLEAFADSLAARGVRVVAGDIVGDDTAWDTDRVRGDWEQYDLLWWYAAPTGALGFNDNSIDFFVRPGAIGRPAAITWHPETTHFVFSNRTRTVARGETKTLDFDRVPGTDTIFAYGRIPADAAAREENFAVVDPALYTATVLREVLERKGIDVRGRPRSLSRPASTPAGATPLVTYRSGDLSTILGPVLRNSQNWFAEQLLKTLGRERGNDGSWDEGLRIEREFLTSRVGLDASEFRLRDASGLSAGNLITPRALTRLLRWARDSVPGGLMVDALPVAGARTGSLRTRLEGLDVRAKTGSIGNVAALSGFVTTAGGRDLVFSIIANETGLPTSRVTEAIDAIVRIVAKER